MSNETTVVATHNGTFHADDVFSVALLKLLINDMKVIRTRDEEELKKADIRVDVGGEYNVCSGDFDHHQRGGAGVHQNGIKKSSIGLTWKYYGPGLLDKIWKEENFKNDDIKEAVWERVNWNLIQLIDAGDTGTTVYEPILDGVQPYTVSQIISSFNPGWEESESEGICDYRFNNAVEFAGTILIGEILSAKSVISAKQEVIKYCQEAQKKDSKIIVFERYIPWQGTLIKNTFDELYVVYPSENKDWRLQCIPDLGSFGKKKPLPESWAGCSPSELNEIIGIEDAVFCHTARFIAGAKSFESIMKMAQLAIEE